MHLYIFLIKSYIQLFLLIFGRSIKNFSTSIGFFSAWSLYIEENCIPVCIPSRKYFFFLRSVGTIDFYMKVVNCVSYNFPTFLGTIKVFIFTPWTLFFSFIFFVIFGCWISLFSNSWNWSHRYYVDTVCFSAQW